MAIVLRAGAVPRVSPTAHLFEGADHGVAVSAFVVDSTPGLGPSLHTHPYAEVFIVHEGEATFAVDGAEVVAASGDIVVAPAGRPHRFTNTGTGRLLMTSISPAGRTETTWLDGGGEARVRRGRSGPGE
jgi:mannose-6-phosphate isomerase-like protein (cupin superfamily)